MAAPKGKCGCKGLRSCLVCEDGTKIYCPPDEPSLVLIQCALCGELLEKPADGACPGHVTCTPRRQWTPLSRELEFSGVSVIQEFTSLEEEKELVEAIDQEPWAESQSGRRKQDYGPKVNFKRHKVKVGEFNGLPSFSRALVERLTQEVDALSDFKPVELCNLDYRPERGASIDPHLDDSWLWGERLVTLNLLSETILTFTPPPDHTPKAQVEVCMPRRSLIIVSGSARYQWQHSIQRCHVTARRIAVTLRELSKEFLPGGNNHSPQGKAILEIAACYTGRPTNKVPGDA